MNNNSDLQSKLVKIISDSSDKYGDLLLKCMDKYNRINLKELTICELKEFIKTKKLGEKNE